MAIVYILGSPHVDRAQIVEMIRAGELTEEGESEQIRLPDDLADATVDGTVTVFDDPLTVFFLTETGILDNYCGYEYTEGDSPIVDPLGSGVGGARSLGDGWYRICAS